MEPAVLILGWRPDVLNASARLGLRALCLVGAGSREWGVGEPLENELRIPVDDHSDPEEVLAALQRHAAVEAVVGVFTADEFAVTSASLVAQALDVGTVPPEVAVHFRDKALQKRALRCALDVADVQYFPVAGEASADDVLFPAVAKPLRGAGASDTVLIADSEQFERHIASLDTRQRQCGLLVEDFVGGEEWHVDGWVESGKVGTCAVSRYNSPLLGIKDGLVASSVTFDPLREPELCRRFVDVAERALTQLGLADSLFHMEIFRTYDDRLVFSECAARLGGAFITETFGEKYGCSLPEIGIRLACRMTIPVPPPPTSSAVGWTYLPTQPGVLRYPPDPRQVEQLPGVVHAVIEMPVGYEMTDMSSSTVVRVGQAMVTGPDEETVRDRIAHVVDWCNHQKMTD